MQNILMKLKITLSLILLIIASQITTVEARTNVVSSNNGSSNLNGLYPVILSEDEDEDDNNDDNDGCNNDEDDDGNDEDEDHDDGNDDGNDEGEDEGEDEDHDDDCSNSCDEEDNNGDDHDGDENEDDDHDGDENEDDDHDSDENEDNDHDSDENEDENKDNGHCTGNNPPPPPAPVLHDLGDAPASYGQASHVLLANNNPFLGVIAPDADVAPQVSIDAMADDSTITGIDDEGGSIFISSARGYFELCGFTVTTESIMNIKVNTTGVANLNGWIDWNADGTFSANEQIFTDVASLGGSVMTTIPVPINAVAGTSFIRIRYSTDIGVGPNGAATDGEVEDCSFTVMTTPPPPPPGKGGKLPPPPTAGGI